MNGFQKVMAGVRRALEAAPSNHADARHGAAPPVAGEIPSQLDLAATFIRELDAVSGETIEVGSETEAFERIASLAIERNAGAVAVGGGITTDSGRLEATLAERKLTVLRARLEPARGRVRERIATCDIGVVEADYGVAATGTLALLATPSRPRWLSLLPPVSLVILRADRIVPDLAAVIRTLGPESISNHPLTLVTGPSRTADIEKRIVLGVHGPRELGVVLLPPRNT